MSQATRQSIYSQKYTDQLALLNQRLLTVSPADPRQNPGQVQADSYSYYTGQIAAQKQALFDRFASEVFGAKTPPIARVITGTNPAANLEANDAGPAAGKLWLLMGYAITMVQGLTQTPTVSLVAPTGTYAGTSSAINASTTCAMVWGPGLPGPTAGGANTSATSPIPEGLFIPAGGSLRTSTSGGGANSDLGAPTITVLEYTLT